MLQELLTFMPREAGSATLAFASVGAACGVALWVSGARFSRYIVTLTAVAIGTGVGVGSPRWFGWAIDGMGPAVGGAIVLAHPATSCIACGSLSGQALSWPPGPRLERG